MTADAITEISIERFLGGLIVTRRRPGGLNHVATIPSAEFEGHDQVAVLRAAIGMVLSIDLDRLLRGDAPSVVVHIALAPVAPVEETKP